MAKKAKPKAEKPKEQAPAAAGGDPAGIIPPDYSATPKGAEPPRVLPPGHYTAHERPAVVAGQWEDYDQAFEDPSLAAPLDRSGWPEEEDLSDLPVLLKGAMRDFDLRRAHVLGHRLTDDGKVVIVTAGGRKITWPDEAERVLSPADKGEPDAAKAPRFWPEGFLEKGPPKAR